MRSAEADIEDGLADESMCRTLEKDLRALTRFIQNLREQMETLGADGYYMLHNHPSGTPSERWPGLSAKAT